VLAKFLSLTLQTRLHQRTGISTAGRRQCQVSGKSNISSREKDVQRNKKGGLLSHADHIRSAKRPPEQPFAPIEHQKSTDEKTIML